MKLLDVALLGGGALLIAAAVQDKSPRDLVAQSVGQAKAGKNPDAHVPAKIAAMPVEERPFGPYVVTSN